MSFQIVVSSWHELGLHKKNAFWESRLSALFISESAERISAILGVGVGGDMYAKVVQLI
jgi:hypothetical protein